METHILGVSSSVLISTLALAILHSWHYCWSLQNSLRIFSLLYQWVCPHLAWHLNFFWGNRMADLTDKLILLTQVRPNDRGHNKAFTCSPASLNPGPLLYRARPHLEPSPFGHLARHLSELFFHLSTVVQPVGFSNLTDPLKYIWRVMQIHSDGVKYIVVTLSQKQLSLWQNLA